MRQNGPWKILESQLRYENPFFTVCEDRVIRPGGEPGEYATIRMKPGACVLPIDADGSVYLTRQFRYALGRESLEVVAGGIDGGETPLQCAHRELREELGIEAQEWRELGTFDLDTSILQCPVHLFTARGLRIGEPDTESTEDIRRTRMSLAEAVKAVLEGSITHSPSCLMILKASLLEGEGRG